MRLAGLRGSRQESACGTLVQPEQEQLLSAVGCWTCDDTQAGRTVPGSVASAVTPTSSACASS